jgi:hypothetical protein
VVLRINRLLYREIYFTLRFDTHHKKSLIFRIISVNECDKRIIIPNNFSCLLMFFLIIHIWGLNYSRWIHDNGVNDLLNFWCTHQHTSPLKIFLLNILGLSSGSNQVLTQTHVANCTSICHGHIVRICVLRFEVSRRWLWRMASSGILHRVALVRNDVSEKRSTSIIRVARIGELGTTLAVTNNRPRFVACVGC